ncbi:MAG: hypothetical protein HYX74_05070 [Acidobacteria bacterium]|nr:hypothetical protein [Acidobacteriota bacterium]
MQNSNERKSVFQRPYLLTVGVTAALTVILHGWAFFHEDRLVVNQILLVFLALLPLLVALSLWPARGCQACRGKKSRHRALHWIGGTTAAFAVALAIHYAWGFMFPYRVTADSGAQTLSPAAAYNYDHFGYSFYVGGKQRRVEAGQPALDEALTDLQGNRVQLSSLWKERPIVVEFGSITCPVFCGKIAPMENLARGYSGKADFYVVYVREAHPGQNYPAHRSFQQKVSHARALQGLEKVKRAILIDSLEGGMNQDYGAMPNSVYVIGRDGVIAYRADWNDIAQTEKQIQAVLANGGQAAGLGPVSMQDNFVKVDSGSATGALSVLRRAGFAAVADFVLSFPRMSMGRLHGRRSQNSY